MVLRSTQFDDVYFSVDDGLAETHHVFFDGNHLPHAWAGKSRFVIAETGFGTGLNFLATAKLFEKTSKLDQTLHFVSVEKYPLSKNDIYNALSPWRDQIGDQLDSFLKQYPLRIPGPHRIWLNTQISLTLWIGDSVNILPQWQNFTVDAWFLDGFTPAKNPDMWGDHVYQTMARLSHSETRFASFTAAGDVRRGLENAGFTVEKTPGFGKKRDMIRGQYTKTTKQLKTADFQKNDQIAIIGGGLAGCALAYTLKRRGFIPVIYETGPTLACGASGGKLGMANPKLSAKPSAQSDYYGAAYAHALRHLPFFDDIDLQQCGSTYLCTDDDKNRRFTGYIDNLDWHPDHIERHGDDLYYPDALAVSPSKLCHALTRNIEIHCNTHVETLDTLQENIIALANGYRVNDLLDGDYPIHPTRGQVTWIAPQGTPFKNTQNLCYGGYITPKTPDGFYVMGATLHPDRFDLELSMDDHQDNLDRFNQATGHNLTQDDVVGGWAALRTSSKDRFPFVDMIKHRPTGKTCLVSTSHGSHGIISSLYAAEILASKLCGDPIPAAPLTLKALSLFRFDKF